MADADYVVQPSVQINPRRAVFVGGVPRPIKAGRLRFFYFWVKVFILVELAHIMEKLYGPVACAGIDTDVEYKYPKGMFYILPITFWIKVFLIKSVEFSVSVQIIQPLIFKPL